jgi:hypothetical protein
MKKSFILLLVTVNAFILFYFTDLNHDFIRKITEKTVVKIQIPNVGSGSGFFIKTKNGIKILSNRHVCQMGKSGFVYKNGDFSTTKKAEIFKISTKHDLCLLTPLEIDANQETLFISYVPSAWGKIAYLVGYPDGRQLSLSKGEVVGNIDAEMEVDFDPIVGCPGKLEPNHPIVELLTGKKELCIVKLNADRYNVISYGGNSGSPILNRIGNVVGVLFAGGRQVTDALAVPLKFIREFLEE